MIGLVFHRWDDVQYVLFGMAVVLAAAVLFGRLARRLGQPAVIGEMLAGVCLGPSVLGHLSGTLFPVDSRPLLKLLSTVGVVVFMFLIGLELRLDHLQPRRRRAAGSVAVLGTLIPFTFGVLIAFPLSNSHHPTKFLPFAIFMGAAMSVTAFPVLARILVENGMFTRPLGVVTMASAALDDVLSWITLAVALAVVASSGALDLAYVIGLAVLFAVVMVGIVRPRLATFADRDLDSITILVVTVAVLLAAFATAAMGLHEIFGAFLAGAIFPRGRLAEQVHAKLSSVSTILLPMFFVVTGLSVDLHQLGGDGVWQFGLILAAACVGKFLGGFVGGRLNGLPSRESVAVGALMNTRGLTELIVLNIGLTAGVLNARLYTMLVLMAVVATVATGPLLRLIKPDPSLGEAPAATEGRRQARRATI